MININTVGKSTKLSKILFQKLKANPTVHINNWVCYSLARKYINLQLVGRIKMVLT